MKWKLSSNLALNATIDDFRHLKRTSSSILIHFDSWLGVYTAKIICFIFCFIYIYLCEAWSKFFYCVFEFLVLHFISFMLVLLKFGTPARKILIPSLLIWMDGAHIHTGIAVLVKSACVFYYILCYFKLFLFKMFIGRYYLMHPVVSHAHFLLHIGTGYKYFVLHSTSMWTDHTMWR